MALMGGWLFYIAKNYQMCYIVINNILRKFMLGVTIKNVDFTTLDLLNGLIASHVYVIVSITFKELSII